MGYMYEVAICNVVISTLVTGFETYCKTRFIELEREGENPNTDNLVSRFFSAWEREANLPSKVQDEAKAEQKTFLEKLALTKINFQNYEDCKRAYNLAYGIKFGELHLKSEVLALLQRLIVYRHRIIHVSPLLGTLNQPSLPSEKPVMSNAKLAEDAKQCFVTFMDALHGATLQLGQ